MFDIGALELLVIVIVAVLVIGPKDMPGAMRTAGRGIGQVRKVSAHFRTGIDAMVREAELEDMEKKWKARNEEIMRQHPTPTAPNAESAVSEAVETKADAPTMEGPPPTDAPALETPAKPVEAPSPPADTADKA